MKQARKKKRPLARWRYFTAATRILRRAFNLAGIIKFKKRNMKGKYEKNSGRSSKVTPSCNCLVFGDKSALKKNSLVVYQGFLGVLYVVSTPPLLTRKNAHDSIEWRTASTLLCHCSADQIYIFVPCKAVLNKWLSRRRRCNRSKIRLNWSKIGIRPRGGGEGYCHIWAK